MKYAKMHFVLHLYITFDTQSIGFACMSIQRLKNFGLHTTSLLMVGHGSVDWILVLFSTESLCVCC